MYKVVSLFDGIGAGRHALNLLNKECEYHAYEVNEPSILVTSSNYEDVIHHGSVLEADFSIHKDVVIRYNSIPFNGRVKESSHLAEANNPLARRKGIDAGRETVRSQYVGDGE